MKMPMSVNKYENATVGIFIFISRENFMLSSVEHEKSFITSGSGLDIDYNYYRVCKQSVSYTVNEKKFITKQIYHYFRVRTSRSGHREDRGYVNCVCRQKETDDVEEVYLHFNEYLFHVNR